MVVEAAGASGGIDLLDFSFTTTVGIVIDLASTAPQVVNAYLTITLSSGSACEWVAGTSQDDVIFGNALANVMMGGAGAAAIDGLGGRDLIVGGTGADLLAGGDDEDILVSGTLSYFNENNKSLNRAAFEALMREWTRQDVAYATRIAHLRTGGGLNGSYRLNGSTITDDGSLDALTGGALQDWYWAFGADVIGDADDGGPETVN